MKNNANETNKLTLKFLTDSSKSYYNTPDLDDNRNTDITSTLIITRFIVEPSKPITVHGCKMAMYIYGTHEWFWHPTHSLTSDILISTSRDRDALNNWFHHYSHDFFRNDKKKQRPNNPTNFEVLGNKSIELSFSHYLQANYSHDSDNGFNLLIILQVNTFYVCLLIKIHKMKTSSCELVKYKVIRDIGEFPLEECTKWASETLNNTMPMSINPIIEIPIDKESHNIPDDPEVIVQIRKWLRFLIANPIKGTLIIIFALAFTMLTSGIIETSAILNYIQCLGDPMLCSMDSKME